MRIRNENFFVWLNNSIFRVFYLKHQGKSEAVVNVRGGVKFWVRVNTSDIFAIWEIWNAKIYDDARFTIREGDTILDIGAHIGVFSVRAARLAHRGHVYAFEPSSKNYAMLIKNLQLNGLDNLHVENFAVSDKSGAIPFYIPANNGVMGSLFHNSSRFTEMVQVTTLADIIAKHRIEQIDLLKIDVEGSEYDILLNCPEEVLMKVQHAVIEYHELDGKNLRQEELVNLLTSYGFNVVVKRGAFSIVDWFGGNVIKTGIIKAWRD